jgi:hypothetical protein
MSLLRAKLMAGTTSATAEIMKEIVSLQLIAEKGQSEIIHNHFESLVFLHCRAHVLLQRLAIYQDMNRNYNDSYICSIGMKQWRPLYPASQIANNEAMDVITVPIRTNNWEPPAW